MRDLFTSSLSCNQSDTQSKIEQSLQATLKNLWDEYKKKNRKTVGLTQVYNSQNLANKEKNSRTTSKTKIE